ncbi:MAG TPA: hypothetical protein VJB93_02975 [Patescibacteria group bacterium]|nr:hypothetical protein [Patescibacteria group bacterium]
MNPIMRTVITALALVLWVIFETIILSQFSYPISSGWWAVAWVIIFSWSASRISFFVVLGVVALGYELMTLQPVGIISSALGVMSIGVLFFEQKIFTRLSWVSYSIVVVLGMATFICTYGLLSFILNTLFDHVISFDVIGFFIEQGKTMVYYLGAALVVLFLKKASAAVIHKYFFSL